MKMFFSMRNRLIVFFLTHTRLICFSVLLVGLLVWGFFITDVNLANKKELDEQQTKIADSLNSINKIENVISGLNDRLAETNKRRADDISNFNKSLSRKSNLEKEIVSLKELSERKDARITQILNELDKTNLREKENAERLVDIRETNSLLVKKSDELRKALEIKTVQLDEINKRLKDTDDKNNILLKRLKESRKTASSLLIGKHDKTNNLINEGLLNTKSKNSYSTSGISKQATLSRLYKTTDKTVETLERALQVSGLNSNLLIKRVLSKEDYLINGRGGPYIKIKNISDENSNVNYVEPEDKVIRLIGLQEVMKRIPLSPPLDELRVSSGFGKRIDPFTNQLAMHPGIDFASKNKSTIFTTAPGVVTFVGWNGGFGKMVEVDHGLGIRTRYAHLSKIFVKPGQKLEFRERLGQVGNTGRSTGTHLHYEILFDGKEMDPQRFLRAGQYLFKT